MDIRNATNSLKQWLHNRQQQALEEAYEGAQMIADLETQYFNGNKIAYSSDSSKTVYDYVRSLRDRQLLRIRINLLQFSTNNFLFERQFQSKLAESFEAANPDSVENEVIQKLNYIESVIAKYRDSEDWLNAELLKQNAAIAETAVSNPADTTRAEAGEIAAKIIDPPILEADSQAKRSRSFFGKLKPFRSEAEEAKYEQQAIIKMRLRRQQNRIALRWLLIIILIPLLVQFLAKHLIFDPLLGNYSDRNPEKIELAQATQQEFDQELRLIKDKLEIESLIGIIPELTSEAKKEKLKEAALDLWKEARNEELNGLKNLFADGAALIVFIGLVYLGRSKTTVLRSTVHRSFLGLNDPIRVFLFIFITDMFVGFHSAEGWEVILERLAEHFGVPPNDAFIKGFIATVPVFFDSCLKFWIFIYLTRFSPASSAIYERMNT